jgi:hypothetical protein
VEGRTEQSVQKRITGGKSGDVGLSLLYLANVAQAVIECENFPTTEQVQLQQLRRAHATVVWKLSIGPRLKASFTAMGVIRTTKKPPVAKPCQLREGEMSHAIKVYYTLFGLGYYGPCRKKSR